MLSPLQMFAHIHSEEVRNENSPFGELCLRAWTILDHKGCWQAPGYLLRLIMCPVEKAECCSPSSLPQAQLPWAFSLENSKKS